MTNTCSSRTADRGPALRGLYRDRENGWMFGVCAGIAERFGFDIMVVRVIAVLSLMLFFVPTALAYLAAVLLLRERPLTYRGARCERDFWRHGETRNHHWRSS